MRPDSAQYVSSGWSALQQAQSLLGTMLKDLAAAQSMPPPPPPGLQHGGFALGANDKDPPAQESGDIEDVLNGLNLVGGQTVEASLTAPLESHASTDTEQLRQQQTNPKVACNFACASRWAQQNHLAIEGSAGVTHGCCGPWSHVSQ